MDQTTGATGLPPSPGAGQQASSSGVRGPTGQSETFRHTVGIRVAGQGRDETRQLVRVWIWGSFWEPAFIQRHFEQLDDDPEREYIVISRSPGTGPYYKLQIIDFPPEGILTWSFDSMGRPKIEDRKILLGDPQKYQGAATIPRYKSFTYTKGGLVPAKK